MGTAYTRQSTLTDGDTITAALFNNEYNQLLTAFSYASSGTTGHQHDGTAGEGGNIPQIGDQDFLNKIVVDSSNNRWGVFVEVSSSAVEQIRIQDGAIVPVTDNDIDLGTASLEFKDAYFDGTVTTDGLTVSGTTNLDGAIQVDNTITVGVDDTGYDVKFFGDTASAYMLWDASVDDLILGGAARVVVPDGQLVLGSTAVSSTAAELNILDGKSFVDEDDMSSNSATAIASQQSIKAYVDSQATDMQFILEDGDGTEVQITKDKEVKFVEGGGIDIDWTDTDNGTDGDPYDLTFTINAAQTGITSIYATDLILGEDAETAIDFGTANEIDFKVDNAARLTLTSSALYPVTNNQIDLGTSSLEFKDAYFDGTVTSDAFAGPLTGDVTGNVSGTAATVTGAAQSNITSLGTLTTLTVDNIIINGTTIGHTDDTDLITLADGVATVAGELSVTTLDIGGTNVTSTAAELNVLDGITAVVGELNALDIGSTAIGTAVASKAVILDANKDYTGIRNFTVSGELDADSLDIEGDADINGTTNLDAVDIDGAVQIDNTVTVGVDDTGYDVKFFGATSGSYMLWDESVDDLILAGASRLVVPDGQLVLNSTAVTSTAAELNLLDGASTLKQVGKETIYVPAAAMYPNTTAGCAALAQVELSNGPELKCLDFDASSDENAQFTVAFPKSWNEGTVTFQVFFTVTGTNTGTVAWGLSGGSMADNAQINTAFGTNVVATAKAHSGTSNDIDVTAESGAVTIANAAADTLTFFQIMRDVSADDQSGDARLLGIKLFFTTDAANDA